MQEQRYTALALDQDDDCEVVQRLRRQLREIEERKREDAAAKRQQMTIESLRVRIKEHGEKPCA